MKRILLFLIYLLPALLSAARPAPPDWIDPVLREERYPAGTYFTGFVSVSRNQYEDKEVAYARVRQEARVEAVVSIPVSVEQTVEHFLQNLDAGTVYRYRTYAKIGTQTLYGAEMSFTTKGEYTPPTYTVRFVNYDGSPLLTLSEVEHGTLPVYTGDTPVRDEDAQYTYTFNGWAPEIVPAIVDATYTATYTATQKTSGIEQLDAQTAAPRKVIENGNLYIILPDGRKFDANGKKVE